MPIFTVMPSPALASLAALAAGPLVLAGHAPMQVRIAGRRTRGKAVPLVLHLHGGAFTGGGVEAGECLSTLLADVGAVVVTIAYPLAPEHPFPAAVEASYAALEWTHGVRGRLAGARAPLFVAGEEAGGNIAAGVAMMARDRGRPELAGLVLVAPMLDPCTATPSQREAVGEQVECKWSTGWRKYLCRPLDAEHPYAVPARAQRLAGLPPTLVLAGEDDPMRDEAMAFAARLAQAGVPVRSGMVPATGWPESLEKPVHPCPCAQVVRSHLEGFLTAPTPPPG
jgi:acetyl esterase